jgi:hypothetical protein
MHLMLMDVSEKIAILDVLKNNATNGVSVTKHLKLCLQGMHLRTSKCVRIASKDVSIKNESVNNVTVRITSV